MGMVVSDGVVMIKVSGLFNLFVNFGLMLINFWCEFVKLGD